MEFSKPKPKKNLVPKEKLMFPLKNARNLIGIFNGQCVTIYDLDSTSYLYEAGNFGKGSLSKGKPKYHTKKDDIPKIMLQHQFENQNKWNVDKQYSCPQKCFKSVSSDVKLSLQSISDFLQFSFCESESKLWKYFKENCKKESENLHRKSVVSLLDFRTENDYKDENFSNFVNSILQSRQIRKQNTVNLATEEVIVLSTNFNSPDTKNSRIEKLFFGPKENLKLSLEESFFLKSVTGCLNIVDLNLSEIEIPSLWEKFNATDKNFFEKYIAYHYFRSKSWVVKSGLKFGGDYLLYKDGPEYYHASYLVKVLSKRKKLTWKEFIAMNRLVETFNKDLLLSYVLPDKTISYEESFPDVLKNQSVQEVLVKRWFPSKERFSKEHKTSI